jgi:RNA polymerase sigma-70 factor, ECF subfamily
MRHGKTTEEMDLVNQLQQGDDSAYAVLYDRYAPMLFGIIYRIVPDKKEAENLLQDCFVKIWNHITSYDPERGALATWLINIARNTAIDFTRSKYFSQKNKNQNIDNLVHIGSGWSTPAVPVETLGLRNLVDKLNPAYRQIIEWMYFDGYTQQSCP